MLAETIFLFFFSYIAAGLAYEKIPYCIYWIYLSRSFYSIHKPMKMQLASLS